MIFEEYTRRLPWEDTDGDISPRQTELATSLRVPILTSEYVRWNYITGIVVYAEDHWRGQSVMPTDDEIRLVGEHLAEYNKYYNQRFLDVMGKFAPFDIDGGANLGYYMKRGDGDWCYRKRTWSRGPQWWPTKDAEPMDLPAVMAHNFNGWSYLKEDAK